MLDKITNPSLPLALVVGACGGMGLACARRLAQDYHVILSDMNLPLLQQHAADMRAEGYSVSIGECDISEPNAVAGLMELVRTSARQHGPLRALAHVVGLSPVAGDWRRIMTVNLVGAARIAAAVEPLLEQGAGVFVSSMAGHFAEDLSALLPLLDQPFAEDLCDQLQARLAGPITPVRSYQISKFMLNRLCRKQAAAWGARGNRIVSLSPGLIATPMGLREFSNSPQKLDLLKASPLQRQGSLQEICDVVAFLLSARASFISGTDILVDGGLTATVQDR